MRLLLVAWALALCACGAGVGAGNMDQGQCESCAQNEDCKPGLACFEQRDASGRSDPRCMSSVGQYCM